MVRTHFKSHSRYFVLVKMLNCIGQTIFHSAYTSGTSSLETYYSNFIARQLYGHWILVSGNPVLSDPVQDVNKTRTLPHTYRSHDGNTVYCVLFKKNNNTNKSSAVYIYRQLRQRNTHKMHIHTCICFRMSRFCIIEVLLKIKSRSVFRRCAWPAPLCLLSRYGAI